MKITCVMIALNEEKNIAGALDSVAWADERLVIDSGSRDRTIEIAKSKGARVIEHKFSHFADQKNFGREQAKNEWVFFLDCDEICDEMLRDSVKQILQKKPHAAGYFVKRRNYFLGKELRFSANRNDYQMRLFQRNKSLFGNDVHEVVKVNGSTERIKNGVIHHYTKSTLDEFFKRFELYTTLEAQSLVKKGVRVSRWACLWKPPVRFVYFYFLKGGFLDGFHGFVYHVLSLFYYFVKLLKTIEQYGKI